MLQDDLHTYIIMELLTGGELFEQIRTRRQFSEQEASKIMKSLISAVQYMSSQNIVHRDLKPENILFSDTSAGSKVKIVDFGFARLKPEKAKATSQKAQKSDMIKTPCFTLNFGAPEVLYQALYFNPSIINNKSTATNKISSKKPSTILPLTTSFTNGYDESCDLWSLGVILYTMLCGRVPFSGDYLYDFESNEDEKLDDEERKVKRLKTSQKSEEKSNVITQEKIIERIRNASTALDFKESRWKNVSESAKQLLRGLLNVDPKKRMKLKELARHKWVKSSAAIQVSEPTTASAVNEEIVPDKDTKGLMKKQFNLAFDAFHAAEKKGLFNIQLKEVVEGSLAQRRQLKRSTSSNASSESSISTNSISSSLSTSTTQSHLIASTPPKKCPLSSNKLNEPSVFNFNDSYVNEYLKQQHSNQSSQQNCVFNRPITRSITHHNNKVHNTDTVLAINKTTKVFDFGTFPKIAAPNSIATSSGSSFFSSSSSTSSSLSSSSSDLKLFISTKSINPLACDDNDQSNISSTSDTPSCKRLKRCSTILID